MAGHRLQGDASIILSPTLRCKPLNLRQEPYRVYQEAYPCRRNMLFTRIGLEIHRVGCLNYICLARNLLVALTSASITVLVERYDLVSQHQH